MDIPIVNSSSILIGVVAALAAAFLWAVATELFGRLGEKIPPVDLNILKCSIALVLMVCTSMILGETLPDADLPPYLLLICSGVIGIGLGDTAFFNSINILGARLALLLCVLAPPMAGIISWLFLGEALQPIAWLGIAITMTGVAWVIWQEQQETYRQPTSLWRGIGFGLLACLAQAVGAVFSRFALTQTTISALQTGVIRLAAGVVTLAFIIVFAQKPAFQWLKGQTQNRLSITRLFGMIILVSLLGTYFAIWLQQLALQFAPVGIVQTLLSTSPVFILPISAIHGEKISWKSAAGVLVALAGVVILFSLS